MKYPKLVRCAKTPVHVKVFSEEPNAFGEHETLLDADFLCNYQDAAQLKYTGEKHDIAVTGFIYIDGDIIPSAAVISCGEAVLFGAKRIIHRGCKARNLDGTVNYTKLEVI